LAFKQLYLNNLNIDYFITPYNNSILYEPYMSFDKSIVSF